MNGYCLGDWGRNGHCCQNDVALEMVNRSKFTQFTFNHVLLYQSRVENVDFVINTGDNFYESGIQSADARKVTTSWYNVYNHQQLMEIPWYGVLGNHDYKGKPEVQFEINHLEKFSSWTMPTRSYRQVKGNAFSKCCLNFL